MKPWAVDIRLSPIPAKLFILTWAFFIGRASAQIIVNYGNGLAEFSAYGLPINTNFVTNLNEPQGIAISGTNIYVANYGAGMIGAYTTSGATVNASLIRALNGPEGLAVSDTNLFVANFGSGFIGKYTTSGTVISNSFISTSTSIDGLAISGTNIYVGCANTGKIGSYSTSGATNNAAFLTSQSPAGLAVSGTNLFVANFLGKISEYTTSGTTNSSALITGFPAANGLAISGGFLYVLGANGQVGLFTTSGGTINPSLFTIPAASYAYFGIAIAPNLGSLPQPQLTATASSHNLTLSWPTNAFAYMLEASSSLPATNWAIVTNTPFITNANYNITLPATNASQYFRLQSIN